MNVDDLRKALRYDPLTGTFTWRVAPAARFRIGEPAGSLHNATGYLVIRAAGARHYAHRLAWLFATGEWPKETIDHINGDRTDNRIANLRDVPRRINCENQRKARPMNKVGFLGVSRATGHRPGNPYTAFIGVHGKSIGLGYFPTAELAHAAYLSAKRRLHEGCSI